MEADLASATGRGDFFFLCERVLLPHFIFQWLFDLEKSQRFLCLLFSTLEIQVCISCRPGVQGSLSTSVHLKWQCCPTPGTSAAKPTFHAREQILAECLLQGSHWDCSRQKAGSKCTLDRNTNLRPTGSTTASKRSEQ